MKVTTNEIKQVNNNVSTTNNKINVLEMPAPRTLREALTRPDHDLWKQAYVKEMDKIASRNTYQIVSPDDKHKAIKSKLVFALLLILMEV